MHSSSQVTASFMFLILLFFWTHGSYAQIDYPVHGEIRTYTVNGQPSVAFYSNHYQLRPLTLPLDIEEDIYPFIWESDSTIIVKNSKVHLRVWGLEMDDGLRTMYELMYGEDKYPKIQGD